MQQVVLKPGRDHSAKLRHPWIFSGAIATAACQDAGEVEVVSAKGEVLGRGVYSPASQIRVRMIAGEVEALIDQALARRTLAPAGGVRLVNAENDGIPGLVVDCYAGYAVCQFTSALAEHYRARILAVLAGKPGIKGVSERLDIDSRAKEGLPTAPKWRQLQGEEPPELVEIVENGLKFLVDVRAGHKTGFYLDQREARALVGSLAKGRTVLNCFAYTGGFGVYAAQGGARAVAQVDISASALALARRNADLNGVQCEFVEADVFKYLRRLRDEGRKFDLIVLDPPKFAESKSQLMKAARGYKDINLLAMKLLSPGGVLATFSCSGAMGEEFFLTILREAALDSARNFQIVARTRQAADHPVALDFPEGLYLKGVVLREYQSL